MTRGTGGQTDSLERSRGSSRPAALLLALIGLAIGLWAAPSAGAGNQSVAITTKVSPSSITLGDTFSDTATLAPAAGGPAPDGNVRFDVYGPGDPTCAGPVILTSTNQRNPDSPLTARSDLFTPPRAGTYRVVATLTGDRNYAPTSSLCADPAEQVTVAPATLPLTTQLPSPRITLGSSAHDTATVGPAPPGTATPTGGVTFNVYGPGDMACASTPVFTSTARLDAVASPVDSGEFFPSQAGTYQVIATYGGDANHTGSASSCADPAETLVVDKAAVAVTTQVAPTPLPLGGSFNDTVTLAAPPGAATPTGTVTFKLYGPGDTECGTPVDTATGTVAGDGTAVSGSFTPTAVGTYLVLASYPGDANYVASSSSCGDSTETETVIQAPLAITTQAAPTTLTLGGAFRDTATIGPPPAGAPAPTGMVTFRFYGASDAPCSAPLLTSQRPVGSTVVSGDFTPNAPGTYQVVASYPGDANYPPSSSACGDALETVTVTQATLSLATQVAPAPIVLGASFHDTATLGAPPAGEAAPTGTVDFAVYGPNDPECSSGPAFTSSQAVNADSSTAASGSFTPAAAGTYRVIASYSGDANYTAVRSSCGDPAETETVGPATLAIATRVAQPSIALGASFHDTATLGPSPHGAAVATGPVRFDVYGPGDPTCTASSPSFTATTALDPAGRTAVSSDFTPAAAGTYQVIATYAGDGNYRSAASACSDPPETVTVTSTTPPPVAPAVTGVTPPSGSTAGGTGVVISGTNLGGATAVAFGTAVTPVLGVNSAGTALTAVAPPGSGTVDVTVTTPFGTSPTGSGDRFAYVPPPAGTTGTTATTGTTTGTTTATTGTTTATTGTTTATTGGTSSPAYPVLEAAAPKVTGSSDAQFTATINPQGLPTTMHFEYTGGPTAGAARAAAAVTYDLRTPEQTVGSDFANHTVTATVAGLLPSHTYHVRAVATNPAGVTPSDDATFTTLSPPVLGSSVNATPVSGTVYVKLPAGTATGAQARASAAKGIGFIPLSQARHLPVGTTFDTSAGVVHLTSAVDTHGTVQSGDFGGGLFKALQNRRERGLTELALVITASVSRACATTPARKAQIAARRALPKTVLSLLKSNVKGRFRTRGRFSSATVRGTQWTTTDRCDGTLTRVQRGVVVVTDQRRHKNIVLPAGRSYLAKAP